MTHRSDQAVSSQDQASPHAGSRPRALAYATVWATAIGALAVSLGVIGLGVWLVRLPLAGFVIGAALADRGAEADFRVTDLGWTHVALSDVRLGSETSPDALVVSARVDWRWDGATPELTALRLLEPQLRLRVDQRGHLSAGALDRISGPPSRERPGIPRIRLDISGGRAEILAPFGTTSARFEASGVLGRDFSGRLEAPAVTQRSGAYAVEDGEAILSVVSTNDQIAFTLDAAGGALAWEGVAVREPSIRLEGHAPLDLARFDGAARWSAAGVRAEDFEASALQGVSSIAIVSESDALAIARWDATARAAAGTARLGQTALDQARLEARASGDAGDGRGGWTFLATRLANEQLVSRRPSASGSFSFASDRPLQGQARLTLTRSHLTDAARAGLRRAFPDLGGAPVGPAFAQARQAFDAAAASFELVAPLQHSSDQDGARVRVAGPMEARAASGAVFRLAPLRDDAPALVMALPSFAVHGALAIDFAGGGVPGAALLFDTVDWAPGAPLDADGTLTILDWRAGASSIRANEVELSVSTGTGSGGRLDLNGPVVLSGPVGDGAVRDLSADLDMAITWTDAGWRASPHSTCQNARFVALEAAGLAFSNGAFALCPLDGALVAANRNGALSGGFSIRQLALNGRMAGPGAQPARLAAVNVVGRFAGSTESALLRLQADTPRLAIDLSEDRTLDLTLRRITGEAHLGRDWSVVGEFENGLLTDPNLPGSVSAIAGRWSARPEDRRPVIRVEAGEAQLTANQPATNAQQPLFNPLRLVDTSGELRAGQIDARGAVVLIADAVDQQDARRLRRGDVQIAHFTAHHDVREGVGGAEVRSDSLQFAPGGLQPYDISSRARGLVEYVSGQATIVADIGWTNRSIAAQGHVVLHGVSLATSTIPIVENVRGDIFFDDMFALTTPPGQIITVGLINPGISVNNGTVRFQLLGGQDVAIENADFEFASGELSMAPTTITLGAAETRVELALRNVDAADLLEHLNMPDLSVTGRVEGNFPLRLTRRSAYISGGVLRATRSGGTIAYSGQAGSNATGAARVAFDALRSFHYDELEMTLDGDLNGEVISSIRFRGENTGSAVDLGDITPIPGVGNVAVRGVPFAFNVTITAPFRRLAQTMSSISNPGVILDRAEEPEGNEPVDQPEAEAEIR